jgi:predicted CXXCH cytochrome family protein
MAMNGAVGKCFAILARVLLLTLVAAGVAEAQGTGILGTKHNLSTSGTGAIHVTTGTAEVCVFCHTPHGADTTVAAPLWNRAINTTGYTMYSSDTVDATPDAQPTGVSLACLSCHDGTIAFDALRNLPGSGGYTDTPSKDGTSTWIFQGTPNKKMPVGAITNLTQDLTNDHPVSMLYSAAKSPSSTSGVNDHATGFKEPDGTGQFSNGIRLYAGKVQCASCHDPHRSNTPTFLRVSNDASAVCLTCHRKDG